MFVCQDRTYSQIAEAWMHYLGNDSISITSSGLSAGQISQYFINVMDEVGVSVDKSSTKMLYDYNPENFDAVISLCDRSMRLPDDWMLRKIFDEWIIPRIEESSLESYREVRDDIRNRVDLLLMRYTV
jgi:glutathione/glutaredoxin type arsenate reductase